MLDGEGPEADLLGVLDHQQFGVRWEKAVWMALFVAGDYLFQEPGRGAFVFLEVDAGEFRHVVCGDCEGGVGVEGGLDAGGCWWRCGR